MYMFHVHGAWCMVLVHSLIFVAHCLSASSVYWLGVCRNRKLRTTFVPWWLFKKDAQLGTHNPQREVWPQACTACPTPCHKNTEPCISNTIGTTPLNGNQILPSGPSHVLNLNLNFNHHMICGGTSLLLLLTPTPHLKKRPSMTFKQHCMLTNATKPPSSSFTRTNQRMAMCAGLRAAWYGRAPPAALGHEATEHLSAPPYPPRHYLATLPKTTPKTASPMERMLPRRPSSMCRAGCVKAHACSRSSCRAGCVKAHACSGGSCRAGCVKAHACSGSSCRAGCVKAHACSGSSCRAGCVKAHACSTCRRSCRAKCGWNVYSAPRSAGP
jgi:hypothetical protein